MRLFLVAVFIATASADLYLQSILGSNNRLDEANRDRNNGNRCFDSQNNNRGGYNVGKIIVYTGESVPLSWTNQHSSGKYQMEHSEVVIQVQCDQQMRDGTTTRTPPDAPTQCINFDCDNDVRYCRHESYNWYQLCKATYRNRGLFTANQNLGGNRRSTKHTRQNPGGTRRGYECPEERDYYPYWRASGWADIAYYTADTTRCPAIQAASDNVKNKGYCKPNDVYWRQVRYGRGNRIELPITEEECNNSTLTFDIPNTNVKQKRFNWVEVLALNISAPQCLQIPVSRANHHGLIANSNEMMTYVWSVPDPRTMPAGSGDRKFWSQQVTNPDSTTSPAKNCVIRLRYNITTKDYQAWSATTQIGAGLDFKNNTQSRQNPNADQDPANVAIWKKYGLVENDVACSFETRNPNDDKQKQCRAYVFRNNPRVDPFDLQLYTNANDMQGSTRVQLQLAINTNQFGRTFQDRTHTFTIQYPPSRGAQGEPIPAGSAIYPLECRGKRGNIVQVYPATEYFFHREGGVINNGASQQVGDFIHPRCAGSNTNPNNNDGQGKRGTDRTNACVMTEISYVPVGGDAANYANVCSGSTKCQGFLGNSYPKRMKNQPYTKLGWSGPLQNKYANTRGVFDASTTGIGLKVWKELCMMRQILEPEQDYGNMEELDDAAADWNMPPVKLGNPLGPGTSAVRTSFLCTRNNNFSNRSQKGSLVVQNKTPAVQAMASTLGGTFQDASGIGGLVVVPSGMTTGAMQMRFSTNEKKCEMDLDFDTSQLTASGWIQLMIPCEPQAIHAAKVNRKDKNGAWSVASKAPKKGYKNGKYLTVVSVSQPGLYKVVYELDGLSMAAVIVGSLAFCCAVGAACLVRLRK